MPLNNSPNPISLGGATTGQSIALELGQSSSGTISLNDTNVRTLASQPTGAVVMPTDFWGKSFGGSAFFDTPGTYSWTVPSGVTSISVVMVGGGGAGGKATCYVYYYGGVYSPSYGKAIVYAGAGGGGGGLAWKNNISVTSGQVLTVVVGAGGILGTAKTPYAGSSPSCGQCVTRGNWFTAACQGGQGYATGAGGYSSVTGTCITVWAGGGYPGGTMTRIGAGGTPNCNIQYTSSPGGDFYSLPAGLCGGGFYGGFGGLPIGYGYTIDFPYLPYNFGGSSGTGTSLAGGGGGAGGLTTQPSNTSITYYLSGMGGGRVASCSYNYYGGSTWLRTTRSSISNSNSGYASNIQGGGGGGVASAKCVSGAGGGGTGIYSCVTSPSLTCGAAGSQGIGGSPGGLVYGSASAGGNSSGAVPPNGGLYGGGGGGGRCVSTGNGTWISGISAGTAINGGTFCGYRYWYFNNNSSCNWGQGGKGAVRIIWSGASRSYPSTNTGSP